MTAFGGDGPLITIVGSILAFLSIACIVLRGLVAREINGKWRWDFIWVAASGVLGIVCTVAIIIATLHGLGNDLAGLSFNDIFEVVHWSYLSIFFGLPANTFAKWSLIALMLQIQGPAAHKRKIALWALGTLFGVVNLIQLILSATQCTPADHLWHRLSPGSCPRQDLAQNFSFLQGCEWYSCSQLGRHQLIDTAVSALTDLVLAIWPISIVYKLQTTLRVKIMFCALMGLGMLPMIASVLRVSKVKAINSSKNVTRGSR